LPVSNSHSNIPVLKLSISIRKAIKGRWIQRKINPLPVDLLRAVLGQVLLVAQEAICLTKVSITPRKNLVIRNRLQLLRRFVLALFADEQISDGIRGGFKKVTGKDVPIKVCLATDETDDIGSNRFVTP
jgi:hypothetical protein